MRTTQGIAVKQLLEVKQLSNFDGNFTEIQQYFDVSTSRNFQESDKNGEESYLMLG